MVAWPIIFIARLMTRLLAVLAWCCVVAERVMVIMMRISRHGIHVPTAIRLCQTDNARHRKRRLPVQKSQQEDSV
jgi:hypothetical protein